ncbi:MAG: molecular chaperone HtpG [Gammaproteobacteria bacterium]
MAANENKETLGFQSEVKQLLDLMIHSLYSNREIFLRELISNASDACDKLRFEALSNDALFEGDSDLNVHVDFDEKAKTITITDNGIGMTREEVIDHIGTIAKSGTKEFFSAITGDEKKDSQLIGQFGVGFYSAFIVADSVTLTTRKAGANEAEGVRWESEGQGEYTIESVDKKTRGTEIVLHMRKDAKEFINSYKLREVIRKYSDHLNLPIIMLKENFDEEGEEKKEIEYETINSAKALWTRSKKEISDEEYNELYKHIGHDYEDPMARIHSQVEGNLEYSTLFYIPNRAPFDLFDRNQKHGVKLYVRRVFIMDDAEQLIPTYLRFIRGIVDTNDLPLNVSREILQHNKVIDKIRAASVKKILGMIGRLAKKDDYSKFWKEFGRVIKEGVIDDDKNKDQIAKLLRFASTNDDNEKQNVSLEDYVGRMQEGQKNIFYVVGESHTTIKNSPHLEIFRNKGIEVLLLSDHVDEWLVNHLTEFDGKELQSITKGELDLGELDDKEGKEESEKKTGEYKDVLKRLETLLEEKVKEVRVTNRLTTSPACLVAGDQDMEASLQRILEASGQQIPSSKRVLEINPNHPILIKLKAEKEDERFNDWGNILFDQALLSEGGKLEDPAGFVHRLNEMFMEMST